MNSRIRCIRKVSRKKWRLWLCCTVPGVLLLLYLRASSQVCDLETRTLGTAGWNVHTSRDVRQYILPNYTTALQQPTQLCTKSFFLLIIVCSAVDHFEARNAIRRSWGSETLVNNATVMFLLGQTENQTIQTKVYAENQEFDDIIQERFIDSYNNLTLKSVMMLKWVNNYCTENIKFIMKADDDTYVNVANLVKFLKAQVEPQELLIGSLICGARPISNTTSKLYVPKYMYPDSIYPSYLSGMGYVMSADVVERLYEAALQTPIFHLEDVYITGLCARHAEIKRQDNPAFDYNKRQLDPGITVCHHVTPREMHSVYYLLHKPQNMY